MRPLNKFDDWLWWQGRGSPFSVQWAAALQAALTLDGGKLLCALDLHDWNTSVFQHRKVFGLIPWGLRVLPGRCRRCRVRRSDWIY